MDRHQIDHLEIVGYADVLTEELVPSIVAPVFRLREVSDQGMQYLFPPFQIASDLVIGGILGVQADWDAFIRREQITPIEGPGVTPKIDHELWIDNKLSPQYEPREDVIQGFVALSQKQIEICRQRMKEGHLDEARQACNLALRVNENSLEALVLKAALFKAKDQARRVEYIRKMAVDYCGKEVFDLLVENELTLANLVTPNNKSITPAWLPVSMKAGLLAALLFVSIILPVYSSYSKIQLLKNTNAETLSRLDYRLQKEKVMIGQVLNVLKNSQPLLPQDTEQKTQFIIAELNKINDEYTRVKLSESSYDLERPITALYTFDQYDEVHDRLMGLSRFFANETKLFANETKAEKL